MDALQMINYLKEKDIQKIKFAFADIDGILRGKIIHSKKFLEGLEEGYGFCDVVFGWDSSDSLYSDSEITGWHTGFPDQLCRIDLSTFRTIPWQDNLPFFLADFSRSNKPGLAACPRSLLKKIIAQCREKGYHAEFAQEFEWFNFKETTYSIYEKEFTRLKPLTPGMFGYSILRSSAYSDFFNQLFDQLLQFGIPVEGLHTETGPGVYEASLIHDEVLKAADKAVLFKTAVKEIAHRNDLIATFMAKWNEKLPGCSGHIHQSLWNQDRSENVFCNPEDPNGMSELFKNYLAGQLYCLPYIMPMYAPTVNSYKRLVENTWAPATVSWGIENRTAALRVINFSARNTRLEIRVPGSDCNPYLAFSAALASGLYGIENRLSLEKIMTTGNAYDDSTAERLPVNLYEASMKMKNSALAAELFGEDFVNHFIQTRLWEWEEFGRQVTNWELKRYFEII